MHFDQPAARVRARIHGLTPWPGCDVLLGGKRLRLLRVVDHPDREADAAPGTLLEDGLFACAGGCLEVLEVQPQGKAMPFEACRNGRSILGTLAEPIS